MSRPTTASSTTSSSEHVAFAPPTVGSSRDPPLQPPRPMFFLDRKVHSVEEVSRDPFDTPAHSAPGTPRSQRDNPFSPPGSVIGMSIGGQGHISHGSRLQSSVSLQSSLRSTTDASVTALRPQLGVPRDSFMSPPAMSRRATAFDANTASRMSVAGPRSKRLRSTMLTSSPLKPWIGDKDTYMRVAYWLTYTVALVGVGVSIAQCFISWRNVKRVGNLCLIMEDNFDTFDTDFTWTHDVDMGGFGNGEFEMTTQSANNSFVEDGKLYILPTLTSDIIGFNNVIDGYTYNITGCTNTNLTSCGAVSNATAGTVINPVMSARLTTKNSHHIQYGKVEIRAKIPRGDWLWPALWMLPVHDDYGPWPRSGEIDIMESRGNSPDYTAQGNDVVRGSLNWGPFPWLNGVAKTYGWWSTRRTSYADDFHLYTLEWDADFVRISVDTRLHHMLQVSFDKPFFNRGDFPPFVANGSETIMTPNPWANATGTDNDLNAAPFDRPFYLIMNVAVGGTNGWFPDGVGDKPWLDGSLTAMADFARAQEKWDASWPADPKDRAMVVDYVKMWQKC